MYSTSLVYEARENSIGYYINFTLTKKWKVNINSCIYNSSLDI